MYFFVQCTNIEFVVDFGSSWWAENCIATNCAIGMSMLYRESVLHHCEIEVAMSFFFSVVRQGLVKFLLLGL